jgi:hypothetical protein
MDFRRDSLVLVYINMKMVIYIEIHTCKQNMVTVTHMGISKRKVGSFTIPHNLGPLTIFM